MQRVFVLFEDEQTGESGTMTLHLDADNERVVYGAINIYDMLPPFVQDLVTGLTVTSDDDVDADIIELSRGRKIRLQKEKEG